MRTTLYRDKILNVAESKRTGWVAYDLGPLKATVEIRIPLLLAGWLYVRELRRQARQAMCEEAALAP